MVEETTEPEEEAPKKKGKGLLFGLIGAVVLGGGGFFATYSGMLALPFGAKEEQAKVEKPKVKPLTPVAFLPLDKLLISLGNRSSSRHLQFAAQLEIEPGYEEEVAMLQPRVLDVMNTYLRAVEAADLEDPAALSRMRAQILRRIQIVTGEGRVRDLLITEFVLN